MALLDRTARGFFLTELLSGLGLTFSYMFRPRVTMNYPFEKGPISPRSGASTHCAAIPMGKSAASPVSCVRPSVPRWPSRSRPSRVTTAAAGRPATISI